MRSFVYGNGQSMFNFDEFGRMRDCYFPYPGLAKHMGEGQMHRTGVFVDGLFSWLDDGSWQLKISADISNSGYMAFYSERLQLEIEFSDALYNESPIFVRRIVISNRASREREIRLFFNVQFELAGTLKGDTAYYDPAIEACVHYEGDVAIVSSGVLGGHGVSDWAIGLSGIEGKEGTWRDAEDGRLSRNSIEHGRVDATFALSADLPAMHGVTGYQWYCVGKGVDSAISLHRYLLGLTPEYVHVSAQKYWHAWITRNQWNCYALSAASVDLFHRSQFVLRAHAGDNGSIIASGDADMLQGGRDTYCYVWPRDGAYIALALAATGDLGTARKFFEFCADRITTEGCLAHKYRPDGSLGSSWHGWVVNEKRELPIQEDEVATVLSSLYEYWMRTHDIEFIESLYNRFIKRAAYFLAAYRDPYTGLPKPSYDLWEERFAVHTYTAAAVCGGLTAASQFALFLGKERSAEDFAHVANEVRVAIMKHCFLEGEGVFTRSLLHDRDGSCTVESIVDASSAYGVFHFGVLAEDDPLLAKAMDGARARLSVPTHVGGIARYEGDQYFRSSRDVPGNPWVITELWYAQWLVAQAKSDDQLDVVRDALARVAKMASATGMLPEQRDPYGGNPLSATPLAWSHAEYVRTVVQYLERCVELGIIDNIYS